MREVSSHNFGLLIAYVIPGLTALLGVSYFSETVEAWLAGPLQGGPTVGGFLYITLAAVGAGVTVSTVRWAVVDTIHHATGIERPSWDFARLQHHFDAYDRLEQNHYKYYQWYGGMVIALLFLELCRLAARGLSGVALLDIGVLLLVVVFFVGSRDTLAKFYGRVSNLLGTDENSSKDLQGATSVPLLRFLQSQLGKGRTIDRFVSIAKLKDGSPQRPGDQTSGITNPNDNSIDARASSNCFPTNCDRAVRLDK